jgi:hypothetical protein
MVARGAAAAYYSLYAARCVEIARETSNPASRAALLSMAQTWMALADQAEKNSKLPTPISEAPKSREQPVQQQQQQQQQQQPPPKDKDRG